MYIINEGSQFKNFNKEKYDEDVKLILMDLEVIMVRLSFFIVTLYFTFILNF